MKARKELALLDRGLLPAPRRGRRILIAVFIIVTLGGGAWFMLRAKKEPITYREHVIERGDIRLTIQAAGEVTPQNRIELKPPRAGRIDEILVEEGDKIRKGQVLAWISSTERAALLDAARAVGPEEVAKWQDIYRPTPLVAPLSGFIIARFSEPGQTVSSGSVPLVMADRLIIRAQVDETDMGKIRIGQKTEISLDAYPEIALRGRVDHLAFEARSINNVTVYDLEIELLNYSDVLRSGMTATVAVVVERQNDVLLAPAEAFTERNGQLLLTLKGNEGKGRPVTVDIGISDGALVVVRDGVKEGDSILIPSRAVVPDAIRTSGSPLMPNVRRGRR